MDPGTATAAPRALEALVTLAQQAVPEGTDVRDGPSTTYEGDDLLVIGWSDGLSPSVLTTRAPSDFGGRGREEGDVVCVLDVYSGDEEWKPLRDRAVSILDALGAELAMSPGIAGAVDGAWFGESSEWTQRNAADGNAVRVAFSVHYVAEL